MLKTVRIRFEKTGRAKYISHLDLNRTMARALRRAAIPLWYTEGFNRHPYITFAAPLSLGFEGLRESMDFRLEEDIPMDELIRRLNAVMPEGLRAVEAGEAVMKPGALEAARYRLHFSCPGKALEDLLAQPALLVEKRTKKKELKEMDIRPLLFDIRLSGADAGACMEVTLPSGGSQNINPALLLQALHKQPGMDAVTCDVVRLDLLAKDGIPFA